MLKKKGLAIVRTVAIVGTVLLMSSCNRGTGCPNNFRLDSLWDSILQVMTALF